MDETKKKRLQELEERKAKRDAAYKEKVEDRDLVDAEAVDALEEKHGSTGIRVVRVPQIAAPMPGLVIIRPPGKDHRAWQSAIARPNAKMSDKDAAHEDLAREIVIYPDREVYLEMVKAYPGLVLTIVGEAHIFSGLMADERGKG